MEKQNSEKPIDIWGKVSKDGQSLAIFLAVGGGLTQSREYLEAMADDPEEGFNLETGMQELTGFGVLQQVTLIQEKREKLISMTESLDIELMPITEVPKEKLAERLSRNLTDEEREYLRLQLEIRDYERNHESQPERYRRWNEPRYRLSKNFQTFIETTFR